MKKIFLFLLCTLMICTCLCPFFATVSSAEDDVTVLSYSLVERFFNASENSVTAVFKSSKGVSLPYRMYVPKDYDASKSYPVVLYFHGAGERGNDNTHIFRGGSILQRLLMPEERKNNPCIIIAPQCAANSQWVLSPWDPGTYDHTKIQVSPYMSAAEELLDDVIKNYSVDTSRLYVSGISMGGFGTWDLISRNPKKFAAAIPVCGGIDESYMEGLKGMPIRTFHAADDPIVSCAGTVRANQLLKDHGDFLYTEYATGGHLIWDKAYGTGGLTTWLFAQKKDVDVGPPMPPTPSDEPTAEPSDDQSPTASKPGAEPSTSPTPSEDFEEHDSGSSVVGTIIGGVVAVVAIFAVAAVVIVVVLKKKKN